MLNFHKSIFFPSNHNVWNRVYGFAFAGVNNADVLLSIAQITVISASTAALIIFLKRLYVVCGPSPVYLFCRNFKMDFG